MQEKVGEQGRLISPCLKAGALRHISVKFCFAELKLFQFAFDVLDNDRAIYCIFTHNSSPPLYIVLNFEKILSCALTFRHEPCILSSA